jgi:hypothetical protein
MSRTDKLKRSTVFQRWRGFSYIFFLASAIVLDVLIIANFPNDNTVTKDDSLRAIISTPDPAIIGKTDLLLSILRDMKQAANITGSDPLPQKLVNFIPRKVPIDEFDDLVLATHTSPMKFTNICTQMDHWRGPVSAALYVSSEEEIQKLQEFLTQSAEVLLKVTLHVMLELPQPQGYPHNQLRNLALENIRSDYFVALDADFIPPKDSYSSLVSLVRSNEHVRNEVRNRTMLVIPAFAILPIRGLNVATPDLIPKTKSDIEEMVLDHRADPFQSKTFPPGHGPTNFKKWFQEDGSSQKKYNIQYADLFEPYVLGYRPGVPRYWHHYRGFGEDKVSWFKELHRAGYKFGVLTDFFVVHLNHPTNFKKAEYWANWRRSKRFNKYLDHRYPQAE